MRSKKTLSGIVLFAFLVGGFVPVGVVNAELTNEQKMAAIIADNNPGNATQQTTPSTKPAATPTGGGLTQEQRNAAIIADNNPGNSPNNPAQLAQPSSGSSGNEEIECWGGIYDGFNVSGCLAIVTFNILGLVSWVLWLAAALFEIAVPYTLNMASFIKDVPIVALGWATFRDLTNLFFIFIILYIAISTIIGNEGFGIKKLLGKVIVGAVLINFSLFFTQAMIDVSNIFALQFYNKITQNDAAKANAAEGGTLGSSKADSGISATFVEALGLKTIWDLGRSEAKSDGAAGVNINTQQTTLGLNSTNLLIASIGGIILVLITSFVFFAATILFLIRTVTLIFLMILSPLAFLGNVLPAIGKYTGQWWEKLFSNLLFAPAYMALLYLVISMVADPNKFKGVGGAKGSFIDIFAGDTNKIGTAMTFVVLNMLMLACLLIASKFGVAGGQWAQKTGMDFAKGVGMRFSGANMAMGVGRFGRDVSFSAGRGAAGFVGDKISGNKFLAKMSSKPYFGRSAAILMQKGDELKGTKIGGQSFNDQVKEEQKNYTKRGNLIEKATGSAAAEESYLSGKRFSYASKKAIEKAKKASEGTDNKEALEALLSGKFSKQNHNDAKTEVGKLDGQIKTVRGKIKSSNNKDVVALNNAKLSALVGERTEQQAIVDGHLRTVEKLSALESK